VSRAKREIAPSVHAADTAVAHQRAFFIELLSIKVSLFAGRCVALRAGRADSQNPLMRDYISRLHAAVIEKGTPALVGLDPREKQLPPDIRSASRKGADPFEQRAEWYEVFCRRIIDVVAPIVPAVKPQVAFFEDCGPAGMLALKRVIRHARSAGLVVIADAKRGDIGSTAEAYAAAWLAGDDPDSAPFAADALTVNPYLGPDTLVPFVDAAKKNGAGLYVLVRTSNPQSGDFQALNSGGLRLCDTVADCVEKLSQSTREKGAYGSVGAVVGATYPAELGELRTRMPSVPLLIPGYGAQGGAAADTAAAFDAQGLGGLVNSSRGVIFSYEREPYREIAQKEGWEAAVAAAAQDFVADLREHTPAKALGSRSSEA
jgi:orotidine-5'-phosphate decarboxylase